MHPQPIVLRVLYFAMIQFIPMFNVFSISGLLILTTSAIMAVVMIARERRTEQVMWGLFCLLVAMWGLAAFKVGSVTTPHEALLWWKIGYVGVIFIPALFTHFVHVFLGKKGYLFIGTLYAISLVYLFANVTGGSFIGGVNLMFGSIYYLAPTPLYNTYMMLWVFLIVYTHVLLYREYRASTERGQQIKFFFLGSFIGFIGGSFSFLPVYGINLYPFENIAVAFYPIIMGYAILRYQLMSLKVVATQAFVGALWVFLFVRSVLSPIGSTEQMIDFVLLLITVGVGLLLIRSVYREVSQREEIERLSAEKSEFMTFASHEIRNPITAMRGLASLIVDGTTGAVPDETRNTAQKIVVVGHDVLNIISTYLNKSKMELGQISYEKSMFDLGEAIQSIAEGYVPHAEQKNLKLTIEIDRSHKFNMVGDQSKVKEVVGNIIDNSLKYTREGGITVSVERHGPFVRAVVADTGVGIPRETLPQLFKKFSRADAQKVNLLGTGIGLYLAKTFIDAQGGRIWAESEGEGHGSRFIVEFPATSLPGV